MSSGITHNSIVLLKSYQWCRNTKSLEKAVPHSLILKSNQRYYTKMNSIELQYLQYISAAQNKLKKKKKGDEAKTEQWSGWKQHQFSWF